MEPNFWILLFILIAIIITGFIVLRHLLLGKKINGIIRLIVGLTSFATSIFTFIASFIPFYLFICLFDNPLAGCYSVMPIRQVMNGAIIGMLFSVAIGILSYKKLMQWRVNKLSGTPAKQLSWFGGSVVLILLTFTVISLRHVL